LLFVSICSPLARGETADLELTKRVDNPAPYEGDALAYTVTLTNRGPDAATGVEVTDQLPAGVSYAWHRASQGSYEPETGVWKVGTLAPSASATLEITVSVDRGAAGSAIVNIAEVTASDQPDPDSTPANGRPGEDDLGSVVIVPSIAITLGGYLSASLRARPQSTQAQSGPFDFELRVYANLSVTLSGLTIASLARLGLTGLEYEAATLRAALGPLQISDQLMLARAPGSGELALERSSFALEGQIQGLRVRSLALWAAGPPPRFEETVTAWGSTAAGVRVTTEAKLCLGEACDHPLAYERVTISGLSLAGIRLMSVTTFRPTEPVEERLALQFKLAELAMVNASLALWPAFTVSSLSIRATEDIWRVTLNYDPKQIKLSRATVALLLPLAEGISLRGSATIIPGEGLDRLITAIVVRSEPWGLSATAAFGQGQLQSVVFTLRLVRATVNFALSARFTPTGLEYVLGSFRLGL